MKHSKATWRMLGITTILSSALITTTVAAKAQEVTVGILVPLTGELGEFGQIVADSIELGIAEINDAGGTKCGMIRSVVGDTSGNAEIGLRRATKMIEADGAVALLGPTSSVMVALVDLAKRTKTVVMSPYAGTITLNKLGGDYVYRTVSSDLGDGAASGLWMTDRGYKRVAFLVQNEESTISPAQVARQKVEASNIELTDYVVYNPGQPSYQAELISVLSNEPDAIYLAGGQESGITVIKEAIAGGFTGEWLFTADLAVPEVFNSVGAGLLNGRAFVEYAAADSSLPEFKAFEAMYMAKTGGAPGPFAANSYDMANLIALSLQSADACTGEAINAVLRDVADGGEPVSTFAAGRDALAAGKDINYEGASGDVAFDASGTVAGSYSIQAAKDGAWVDTKFYPASAFE